MWKKLCAKDVSEKETKIDLLLLFITLDFCVTLWRTVLTRVSVLQKYSVGSDPLGTFHSGNTIKF